VPFSLCDTRLNFHFCAAHFLRRFLDKYAVCANFCYKKRLKLADFAQMLGVKIANFLSELRRGR
jgi:hypothetical protein